MFKDNPGDVPAPSAEEELGVLTETSGHPQLCLWRLKRGSYFKPKHLDFWKKFYFPWSASTTLARERGWAETGMWGAAWFAVDQTTVRHTDGGGGNQSLGNLKPHHCASLTSTSGFYCISLYSFKWRALTDKAHWGVQISRFLERVPAVISTRACNIALHKCAV